MTEVGPMLLAAVMAETFEEYSDDGLAHEAGQMLHEALERRGYQLTSIGADSVERAALNTAATGLVRRFADAMGHYAVDMDRVARAMAALDVEPDERRRVEDAAWASVWLHCWRAATRSMTTEERTAAADAVERDWARAEADDPSLTHGPESRAELRWWEA